VAKRNIKKGEELAFDYNTTEYDLVEMVEDCSFKCNCKSENCLGWVGGFVYLNQAQKLKLKKYLSPYLMNKFNKELI